MREHTHQKFFAIGQCFVCYRPSAVSQPACLSTPAAALPRLALAFGRLVLASLPKCGNKLDKDQAVGRPHVNSSEFESLALKQLHCLTAETDVNFIGDSYGWQ